MKNENIQKSKMVDSLDAITMWKQNTNIIDTVLCVCMCTVQSVLYIKKAADDDDDEEDEEGWSMISNVYIKTVNTHSPPHPPSAWNDTHLNWKTFVVINTRFFTIKWAYFHGVYTLDDAIFFIAYALFGFYPHFYYF